MNENPMNPGIEDEQNDSPIISMSQISYNKETGEAKRNLFWMKMNAEGGDVDAMCNLGSAYLIGTDVDRDPEKAAYWFEKAAAEGESIAMFNLGLMYAKGFGVERSFEKAAEWMRKAKKAGDDDAGRILPQFEREAEMMKNAEAGDTNAQALLSAELLQIAGSNMLDKAGPEQDYSDALYWAWKAAKAGEPIAMNTLGILYSKGWGTAKNYEESFRWYLEAAERGFDIAMSNVAYDYVYGKGVALDLDKSVAWFEKAIEAGWNDSNQDLPRTRRIAEIMHAAKAGSLEAQADIADELRGIGLSSEQFGQDPRNAYEESLFWAKKAADAGSTKGMRVLGLAWLLGRGVEKNPDRGAALLQKACDLGDPDAMLTLGEAYLKGDSLERDVDRARELLSKAKELGNEAAAELLDKLEGKGLAPDEQANLALRFAVAALSSGKTPEQVSQITGIEESLVMLINVVRLLRGLKETDENIDNILDMPTKMIFTMILSKLEKGERPDEIAAELPVPENVVNLIAQIDTALRNE